MLLFVLMESIPPKRRFPPPWRAEQTFHGYVVSDANGVPLAYVHCRDDLEASASLTTISRQTKHGASLTVLRSSPDS
jgi:hypothetical protein